MTPPQTLAVFGAAGATGQHVVRQAVERGHLVRAIEPEWPGDPGLPEGATPRTANVLRDDLAPALEGCDAVVSAIGLGLSLRAVLRPPPVYTEGALHLIDAMNTLGIRRLIVVSASFVETRDRGPIWFRATSAMALERVFTQMAEMERILRASDDMDWTAVRPGWLMEGPLTADYTVTPDVIPRHLIRTRHADLAHFMLNCVETGEWIRAAPAIARAEPASASGPSALMRELAG